MPLNLMTRLDPLRRIRCPFCFESFAAFEMHLRCNDHGCKSDFAHMIEDPILSRALNGRHAPATAGSVLRGPWWIDPRADYRRGICRHPDWLILPDSLPCPIAAKAPTTGSAHAATSTRPTRSSPWRRGTSPSSGPQSVGKTTFITALLHELDHRIGSEHGFILEPLTDEIRDRYDREYHELTYGGSQFDIGEDLYGESYRRGHSATPSLDTNRGVLQP